MKKLSTVLLIATFVAGLSLLLYPTVSNYWNTLHASRAVATYVDAVQNMGEDKRREMLQKAIDYNKSLTSDNQRLTISSARRQEYESILDVDNSLWSKETEGIEEFYAKFGDKLPATLRKELDTLKASLAE